MTHTESEIYGANMDVYMKGVKDSITYKYAGAGMIIAGILSDCQEMLEHNSDKDDIRKELNKAKHILFSAMQNEIVFAVER